MFGSNGQFGRVQDTREEGELDEDKGTRNPEDSEATRRTARVCLSVALSVTMLLGFAALKHYTSIEGFEDERFAPSVFVSSSEEGYKVVRARVRTEQVLFGIIAHRGAAQDVEMQRETWLNQLHRNWHALAAGEVATYRVFVGRENDNQFPPEQLLQPDWQRGVVELDAEDTYEGLPEKVVSAVAYALRNGFEYFFKVDSDILIFPRRFLYNFHANLRGKDFFGLVSLIDMEESGEGECRINRNYHFGRCKLEFLNSQEYGGVAPLSVAGGVTYGLSKAAMQAVVDTVRSPRHQRWLQENRRVNLYEDLLMSYLVVVRGGFNLTDYSDYTMDPTGWNVQDFCGSLQSPKLKLQLQQLYAARTAAGISPRPNQERHLMSLSAMAQVGIAPRYKTEEFPQLLQEMNDFRV